MKQILFGSICLLFSAHLTAQEDFRQLLQQKTMKEIRAVVDTSSAVTGLVAVDLTSGETFAVNENAVFTQASCIKIPILIEVYKQASLKKFALTDIRPVKPADVVAGSGIIQSLPDPSAFSIRNLCILMISISDNTATNMLIDLVGMSAINATMQSIGYSQTKVQRRMINPAASARGEENISTPAEAARMLQAIYKGEMIDKASSQQMIAVLNTCKRSASRLARGLPANVPILFKDGVLAGVSTEWAIIPLAGRPYAVAIMENFKPENKASESMEKISAILYQYFWRIGNASKYGTYVDRSLMK